MKIGIVSDTHRMTKYIDKAIPYLKSCDLIVHAGDNYSDARYIYTETSVPVMGVVGNCDYEDAEEEVLFDFANKKFFVCHGHRYDVKYGINSLRTKAEREKADIVVFGHSHETFSEVIDGVLYINPGSLALPRGGTKRGFAILDIDGSNIKVKEIEI